MRRNGFRRYAAPATFLLLYGLSLASISVGDEFFPADEPQPMTYDDGAYAEPYPAGEQYPSDGSYPDDEPYPDEPPPNPLPEYAPRAKVEAHFPQPTRTFSLFDSLTSYGAACRERCMPKLFSPRGVGFARRTSAERMDYSPYVTKHEESSHGPSYFKRHHLPPCCQQHHFEWRGTECGWSAYY